MTRQGFLCHTAFCVAAAAATAAFGGTSTFYRELNLLVGYSDVEGWIGEGNSLRNSAGFEYYGKRANEFGDFLTLNLQARASYDTSDDLDERWALEIHNAWADWKPALGRTVRAGHFAPAYGLESYVDTHGTLFQTLAMQDIGFKKDWGIGYRTGLGPFDGEVAAGLGSGMGIARRDGSYAISGRIGTPQNRQLNYGLSAFHGELLEGMPARTLPEPRFADTAVRKRRVGADMQYLAGAFLFRGELTAGRNESDDVVGGLVQADYTVPSHQVLTFSAQVRTWTDDPGDSDRRSSGAGVGLSYSITPAVAVRLALFEDLESPGEKDTRAFLQVYAYGR